MAKVACKRCGILISYMDKADPAPNYCRICAPIVNYEATRKKRKSGQAPVLFSQVFDEEPNKDKVTFSDKMYSEKKLLINSDTDEIIKSPTTTETKKTKTTRKRKRRKKAKAYEAKGNYTND